LIWLHEASGLALLPVLPPCFLRPKALPILPLLLFPLPVPPLPGLLPSGSPSSSRGNSPSPRGGMYNSVSPQPGSAQDAVSGLRANSNPNMVRPGAGSPGEQQLRSSITEQGGWLRRQR
jgi:hypothetical protein